MSISFNLFQEKFFSDYLILYSIIFLAILPFKQQFDFSQKINIPTNNYFAEIFIMIFIILIFLFKHP